jgi:U3 small nucleolar RNA-associated protein 22
MAPAIKRRKLKHDDENYESDVSFANDAAVDVHANTGSLVEELDEGHTDEDGPEQQDSRHVPAPKNAPALKTSAAPKLHRRPDAQLQDGAYTAESFKSNVFRLQIDELLEQVKPKYGKKEAPAENAMRMLKSVIEQLPSRESLSVCSPV